jgi:hypothetical protein
LQQLLVTQSPAVTSAVTNLDPRLSGWGTRGGIGFIIPDGNFPTALGSNLRVEVGGSYAKASGDTSGGGTVNSAVFVPNLAGIAPNFSIPCFTNLPFSFTCASNSALHSDYAAWQIFGKLASDHRVGQLTLTPSVAIFGGRGDVNQSVTQSLNQITLIQSGSFPPGSVTNSLFYQASTALSWTDAGARIGLESAWAWTNWLSTNAGGFVGVASRNASLTGADAPSGTNFALPGIGFPFAGLNASTLSSGANATPVVANLELGASLKQTQNVTLRLFGGLNYDSLVPGIAPPQKQPGNKITFTPASIEFAAETSYYGGASFTVRW